MSKSGNIFIVGCNVIRRKWRRFAFSASWFYFLLTDEADEEVKESETTRGLSDEEKKEVPSQIINNLDKGFSILANFVSDEVKK